jgi:flagellar basal body-associated protein FliL
MWRSLNWQPKLIIGLISAIALIIFVYAAYVYLSGQSAIEKLENERHRQKEANAVQTQIAVNKIETNINAINANIETIKTANVKGLNNNALRDALIREARK